tara:strand:- start:2513 stop:2803 length:291 start_codon:yes stop_codon:yes gene_type:complete
MKRRFKKLTESQRVERLQQAMFNLIPNENFALFIDHLRDARDYTSRIAGEESVIASERISTAYQGSINTYNEIIDTFDDFQQQLEDRSVEAQERAQ